MKIVKIEILNEVRCPTCGAPEVHSDTKIHIRVSKVHDGHGWSSQCLVCSGGYDKPFGTYHEPDHDPEKGWFYTKDGETQ
jgi:hypothetical protein